MRRSGDAECLRDEITLLAHKATLAGVQVQHELHVDQVHVFQSFPFLESSGVAFRSIAKFFRGLQVSTRADKVTGIEVPIRRIHVTVQEETPQLDESRATTPMDEDAVASEMAHGETKLVKSDGTEVDIDQAKDDEVEDGNDKAEQMLQDTIDREEEEEEQRDQLSPLAKSSPLPPMLDDQDDERDEDQDHNSITINHITASEVAPKLPGPESTTPQKPFMRRALSGFARANRPESPQLVRRTSGSSFFSFSAVRPSTPIVANQDMPQHPPPSPSAGSATLPGAISGLPAVRGHRPTISHHLTRSPVVPTTRARSQSHSDMISLVHGYSRGGAANSTVVYSPGPVRPTKLAPDDMDLHTAPLDLDAQPPDGNTSGGLGLHMHG